MMYLDSSSQSKSGSGEVVSDELRRIRAVLDHVLASDKGCAYELRTLYIQTATNLQDAGCSAISKCFMHLLNNREAFAVQDADGAVPLHQVAQGPPEATLRLLRELCTHRAADISQLLFERDPSVFQSLFRGSTRCIVQWFGQFSMDGIKHFKHGSTALANYALSNRDQVGAILYV